MGKKSVILLLIGLLIFSNSGFNQIENTKAVETTFYVDDDGFEDYVNIQYAIDNASIGDTVYVYHGYYKENLVINKSIKLIGEGKGNTTIDGYNDIVISIISNTCIVYSILYIYIIFRTSIIHIKCCFHCFCIFNLIKSQIRKNKQSNQ